MLFKVLVDNKPCHGGVGEYPPVGQWTESVRPKCCSSGWHLTSDPLAWWMSGSQLWVCEADGAIDGDDSSKAAFERVRLMELVTKEWRYLSMFPRVRAFIAASLRSLDKEQDILWANLTGANLTGASLPGANLSGANLSGANLSWANLSGVDLSEANLSGASLSGAILWGANLPGANLSGANLSGANLSGAGLPRANLSWANLSGANLSWSDLSGASLSWANLFWADLSGVNLLGAGLYGALCDPGFSSDLWKRSDEGRLQRKV